MKRILILLVFMGALVIWPYHVKAIYVEGNNGVEEDEVTILSEPYDGNTSNSSTDKTPEEDDILNNGNASSNDTPVSSDDNIVIEDRSTSKATVLSNSELYQEGNQLLYIISSLVVGLIIGSVGSYIFITKRKEKNRT
ncbi:MAG: hypothetical protein PHO63_00680 [Bacilli bacterium]|nr:hypothetical protein [Bacilli bacterium]MDD4809450.1 hypothetical protein [Bacilli bacterium]